MKPATQEMILSVVACLGMMTTVFAKPLGIPDPWAMLPLMLGLVCFFFIFHLRKKMKTERERAGKPAPVAPLAARKKVFWIVAVTLVISSITSLPLLPYTAENFQPWIYYWVIPAQIIFLAVFLPFYWKKMVRADATNPSGETPKQ